MVNSFIAVTMVRFTVLVNKAVPFIGLKGVLITYVSISFHVSQYVISIGFKYDHNIILKHIRLSNSIILFIRKGLSQDVRFTLLKNE